MKICVGRTGHEIADKVSESLVRGLGHSSDGEVFIGYGILRGMAEAFKKYEHWFNVDRGYFAPSHFDGYYRISYRGTQARYSEDLAGALGDNRGSNPHPFSSDGRGYELAPVRKHDRSKPWLVCPPTEAVKEFFHLGDWGPETGDTKLLFRKKGDPSPIPWGEICGVITFNSSVGWQAVCRGLPCLSDTTHSVVGSYYGTNSLDELIDLFNSRPREPILDFCRAHQFTLREIENGKACPLITKYLSDTIPAKPSVPMSPPTPSAAGLQNYFQSAT